MNIRLINLVLRTRKTIEDIPFSGSVTFLYGPVGTGKSTVARLVDYCFGGNLERTPAIQQEFVSVILNAKIGNYDCSFERGAEDAQAVRVTWSCDDGDFGSVSAPLAAGETPLLRGAVYNLSDLLFHLCGIEPIKVLKRSRDPDSQIIRLSFRDIWRYCYLDQTHLDSSFFRLEDPFKGRKSQDAMRFFTGLHSERLSQLQAELYNAISEQHGAQKAVEQIRRFMSRFNLGSDLDLINQIDATEIGIHKAKEQKQLLEADRLIKTHPTDELKCTLREFSNIIENLREAIYLSRNTLAEQEALRAELITAKLKAVRAEQAGRVLDGVNYSRCPQCGIEISGRLLADDPGKAGSDLES